MMEQIQIRVATLADAAELLAIYAPYVEETAITFEYEVPTPEEFQRRMEHTLEKYPYLVAVYQGEIMGYVYAGTFKGRPAYDWCVETSIYIKKDCKRMGIGAKLYEELEKTLKKQNILNLNASIAYAAEEEPHLNHDSVRFHEKMGYRMVGTFHKCGYKYGRWYDMLWMEKFIGEHGEKPERMIPFPLLFTFPEL